MLGSPIGNRAFIAVNAIESFREIQAYYPNGDAARQSFVNQQIRSGQMCPKAMLLFWLACFQRMFRAPQHQKAECLVQQTHIGNRTKISQYNGFRLFCDHFE